MTKNLFLFVLLVAGMSLNSCSNVNGSDSLRVDQETEKGKSHVHLKCHTSVSMASMKSISTRAALTANGRTITDLYIMDYDKVSGKLLQVLHQTSDSPNFAEPDLTLDYGEHTLKVIATRSERPTLLDAASKPWAVTANVLTQVSAAAPVAITADKTSDTFGAQKNVAVGIGQTVTVSITLDRLAAKLVVNSTDDFPVDCSTIEMQLNEYKAISWTDVSVIDCVKNQRVTDVSSVAGKKGTTINYFFLTPEDGYTTDITFTTNSTKGVPYSNITVPNVLLERNKVTTITGSFYNHQQGVSISLNDEWNGEGNEINI